MGFRDDGGRGKRRRLMRRTVRTVLELINRDKHQIGFDFQFIIDNNGSGGGQWRRIAEVRGEGRPSLEEVAVSQAR